MTEGTLTALIWTSSTGQVLDLHAIPGLWCDVIAGLDDLPPGRAISDIVPFRPGRLSAQPIADNRPVIVEGQLIPTTGDDYAGLVRTVKRALDPFGTTRGTITATLEDGSVRTIGATPRSILHGEPLRIMPRVSIEFDADPYWRGVPWDGAWLLDTGLYLDDGLFLDMGAGPVTITPTADPHDHEFATLGTTATHDAVIEVDGPSTGAITVSVAGGIGFSHPALASGQTLIVDAGASTATIGGLSVRAALTLLPANPHGEFLRLRPGTETVTVTGEPAEVRIAFRPTYL